MNSCPIFDFFNSSFVSAAFGGLIGGGFTFWGVKLTIENEKRKSKDSADAEVKAFCQAILTELEAILARYLESIGNKLGEHKTDQPFLFYYHVAEDYFTIFDSNAHMIGKIKNDELRSKIVKVYINVKGLVDSFRMNNNFLSKFEDFATRAPHTKLPYDEQQRDLYLAQLKQYMPSLLSQHASCVIKIEEVIRDLKKEVED